MYKVRIRMYDNINTNYIKKHYKNVIYNVFMSSEEKTLKDKTDWILEIDEIKKKYTYEGLGSK